MNNLLIEEEIRDISSIGEKVMLVSKGMSLCEYCRRVIPSETVIKDGYYWLVKDCPFDKIMSEKMLEKVDLEFPIEYNLRTKNFPHYRLKIGQKEIEKNDIVNIQSLHMILLFLTQKCNSNCSICYDRTGTERQDLSIKIIKKILKNYKDKEVVLYGGEPTVREDLPEIIKVVKDSGNFPILFTNGLKLTDFNYLRMLIKAGLSCVYLSFDGFRKEIYETIRGGAFEYEEKLKALYNLERENLRTIIAMTVIKGFNEDQIAPILDFAQKHSFISELTLRPLYLIDRNHQFSSINLISRKEILDIIAKYVNIPLQYFKDFYELKIEAYNFLKKFKKVNYPIPGNYDLFVKKTRNGFLPLLTLQEIENLRGFLQKKKRMDGLFNIFKNKTLRRILWIVGRNWVSIPHIKNDFARQDIFRISLGQIRTEWDSDLSHILNSINLGFARDREFFIVAGPL